MGVFPELRPKPSATENTTGANLFAGLETRLY